MNAALKQTLDLSLFFTDLQQRLRNAKSYGELTTIARELESKTFYALPSAAQADLEAQFRAAARKQMGGEW